MGVAALTLAAPAASADSTADAVSAWNENARKAAIAACISPVGPSPAEARLYAMTHVAIHDALNAIDPRSKAYAYHGRTLRATSPEAAIAAAARGVLVPILGELTTLKPACVDAAAASVEADYTAALAAIGDSAAKTRGIALGQAAAGAILRVRSKDHMQRLLLPDFDYDEGSDPGEYRFTGLPFAFASHLGRLAPFVLRDGSQFRPGPPHAVTDPRYTADLNEVKRLGGDGSTTTSARTPDQTEIALFWYESSPLQWNRIAEDLAVRTGLDAWERARLFGLLNMALIDGYIGSFETKYEYDYWRPVTAVRLAATDGNPDTAGDPSWTPLRETPEIPDYDSGHSVEGGAGAGVLRRFFGTDDMRFSTCSTTLEDAANNCGGTTARYRAYGSFTQAAEENAASRIYIGFHFREATAVGTRHGGRIADRVVDRSLQPRVR